MGQRWLPDESPLYGGERGDASFHTAISQTRSALSAPSNCNIRIRGPVLIRVSFLPPRPSTSFYKRKDVYLKGSAQH